MEGKVMQNMQRLPSEPVVVVFGSLRRIQELEDLLRDDIASEIPLYFEFAGPLVESVRIEEIETTFAETRRLSGRF
jgi:hypothetical protein